MCYWFQFRTVVIDKTRCVSANPQHLLWSTLRKVGGFSGSDQWAPFYLFKYLGVSIFFFPPPSRAPLSILSTSFNRHIGYCEKVCLLFLSLRTELTERFQFLCTLFSWFVETSGGYVTPRPLPSWARRMHGIGVLRLFLDLAQEIRLPVVFKRCGVFFFLRVENWTLSADWQKLFFSSGENVRCPTIKREPDAGADGSPSAGSPETFSLQKPLRLGGSRKVKEGF